MKQTSILIRCAFLWVCWSPAFVVNPAEWTVGWVSDLKQTADVCLPITQERWFTTAGYDSVCGCACVCFVDWGGGDEIHKTLFSSAGCIPLIASFQEPRDNWEILGERPTYMNQRKIWKQLLSIWRGILEFLNLGHMLTYQRFWLP